MSHDQSTTLGPWVCIDGSGNYAYEVCAITPRGKAVVARIASGLKTREADARLIAAAPDLLSALQMVLNEPSHATREQARAAIAKATGADHAP